MAKVFNNNSCLSLYFFDCSLRLTEDGIALSLSNIGVVYHAWGQYDKAIESYQQALAIAKRLGTENDIATYLNYIRLIKNKPFIKNQLVLLPSFGLVYY